MPAKLKRPLRYLPQRSFRLKVIDIVAFDLNQFDKFECAPDEFVVHNSAQIDFLKTIVGGLGKCGPV